MSDQESEIQGISFEGLDDIQIHADFLTNSLSSSDNEGISGTYEKNINGDGKLALNWRSSQGGGLSAGQVVTVKRGTDVVGTYYLEENYVPSPNGDGTYTWSPTFIDTDSKMKGVLVYKEVKIYRNDVQNTSFEDVKLWTFPYTGEAGTLVSDLNDIAAEGGFDDGFGNGCIELNQSLVNIGISVSFDQDNLVSASEKVADALGVQCTIEDGKIKIGAHSALAVSEHYDRFIILGGTRNMGKRVMDGDDTYAAVTMRLTLPNGYTDSAVTLGNDGSSLVPCVSPNGHMSKVLIFDDIYPKIKMKVASVRERVCYLYDDEGKIMVANGVPRTYSKFYITLDYYREYEESEQQQSGYEQFHFDVKSVIQGRTLGIVFQSGLLTGREFDLAYYDEDDDEYIEYKSDEDYEWYDWPDGQDQPSQRHTGSWAAAGGEFRICIVADGDTLLPNSTLCPREGDFVTITGVVIDNTYEEIAKKELLEAALPYVKLYMSTKATDGEYSQVSSSENEYVTDFLTGETINVSPGDSCDETGDTTVDGDYIITSVTTDIKTGKQSIRFGTFEPQSKMSSMANKLETASVSAGGALVGQGENDDNVRHTAAMGLEQFKTLYEVYGHMGIRTVNRRVDTNGQAIAALQTTLDDVVEQADKKFDIWFIEGRPQPYYDEENETITGTANFPATEWATNDEKEAHLQDICYDTTRPADGTGGMAWRWEKVGNAYCWKLVSDSDTIAALTQLTDLSRDNILTPSEKLALKREWENMMEELADLVQQSEDNDIDAADYICAYYTLWQYLNVSETATADTHEYIQNAYKKLTGATPSVSDAITYLDAYLADHSSDTEISTAVGLLRTGTAANIATATESLKDYMMTSIAPLMVRTGGNGYIVSSVYNDLLTAYKTAKTSLMTALSEKSLAKLDDMASDNKLTDIEKLAVIRDYERMVKETVELIARSTEAGLDVDSGSVQYQYRQACSALYAYLNNLTTVGYNVINGDLSSETSPAMLYNGTDTQILGTTFTGLWAAYYEKAAALRQAIQSKGVKVFSTNSQSSPANPVPPYRAGDIWIHTDASGKSTIRICIASKASGSFDLNDWAENEIYSDPRSVLAALGDLVFKEKGSTTSGSVTVTLSSNGNSVSNTQVDYSALLAVLRTMLGDTSFTISWGNDAPSSSGTIATYSLYCQRSVFKIGDTDTTLTGGCKIMMYNENGAWEFIQQSTSAVLDNVGNMINLVVFGTTDGSLENYIEGSGITTQQNFVRMFAEAQMWDASLNNSQGGMTTIAAAMFGLSVQIHHYKSKTGNTTISTSDYAALSDSEKANYIPIYVSSAQLSADKIDFQGKTIGLNGTTLTLSGGVINMSGATSINLNAPLISLNAEKITWKAAEQSGTTTYRDIIPGNTQQSGYTVPNGSKFAVDDEGNVFMNNATVRGAITANTGYIGGSQGWEIAAKILRSGTFGANDSMWLSTDDMSGSSLATGHFLKSFSDLRLTIGQYFGVLANGTLVSMNGLIKGQLVAESAGNGSVTIANGQIIIEGNNGKMVFGFDNDGSPLMQYKDDDDNVLYDIGSTGVSELKINAPVTENVYMGKICEYQYSQNAPTFNNYALLTDLFKTVSSPSSGSIISLKTLFKCQRANGELSVDGEGYVTSSQVLSELDNRYYDTVNNSTPKIESINRTTGYWYYPVNQYDFGVKGTNIKVHGGYGTPDPDYDSNSYDESAGGIMEGGWPQSYQAMSNNPILYVEAVKIVDGAITKRFKIFMKKSYYDANKSNF